MFIIRGVCPQACVCSLNSDWLKSTLKLFGFALMMVFLLLLLIFFVIFFLRWVGTWFEQIMGGENTILNVVVFGWACLSHSLNLSHE